MGDDLCLLDLLDQIKSILGCKAARGWLVSGFITQWLYNNDGARETGHFFIPLVA